MMTLSDSTERIQHTTEQLAGGTDALTPEAGVALIDEWLEPLTAAENTKPIADKLQQVKTLLAASPVDEELVQERMGELAELTATMGIGMGSEGEMPSLLDGLASALRQAGQTSRADE